MLLPTRTVDSWWLYIGVAPFWIAWEERRAYDRRGVLRLAGGRADDYRRAAYLCDHNCRWVHVRPRPGQHALP
ncbi:hypothetical protein FAIPA1_210020 [Frankia sp. AiPs1]